MSIGFTAARGSTYQTSIGARTSRNVPIPSRIRERGEAVRRIRILQGRKVDGVRAALWAADRRRLLTGCQCLSRLGRQAGVGPPGGDDLSDREADPAMSRLLAAALTVVAAAALAVGAALGIVALLDATPDQPNTPLITYEQAGQGS